MSKFLRTTYILMGLALLSGTMVFSSSPDHDRVGSAPVPSSPSSTAGFNFLESEEGVWVALNRNHQLRLSVSSHGLEIAPQGQDKDAWRLTLRTTKIGRSGSMVPVGIARIKVRDNRVDYERKDTNVTESYVNDSSGVEQIFVISERPEHIGPGESPLAIEMAILGTLHPRPGRNVQQLILIPSSGGSLLRYARLLAYDASGRDLPIHLDVKGKTLTLIVDDSTAIYPVTIDPHLTTELVLSPFNGSSDDRFAGAFDASGDPTPVGSIPGGVALDGDTLVIGASGDDDVAFNAGAVYVFQRSGSRWSQQAKLLANDLATTLCHVSSPSGTNCNFGFAVAIDGDRLVVGSPGDNRSRGAAYVFQRTGGTWVQQTKLIASDPQEPNANQCPCFGGAVDIQGDTIVIGAYGDGPEANPGSDALGGGSVYVYELSGQNWIEVAKLRDVDPLCDEGFGRDVSMSGDSIAVATLRQNLPMSRHVNVFVRTTTGWTRQARLDNLVSGFGGGVALNGDVLVVGIPGDDSAGINSGAVAVWKRVGSTWTETARLTASDATSNQGLGNVVSFDGASILATRGSFHTTGAGAAYVFRPSGTTWIQDQKLTSSDAGDVLGGLGDGAFISGNTAIVGGGSAALGRRAAFVFQDQPGCIDNDGDGFGSPGDLSCLNGDAVDCDDLNASVNPAAMESCDAVDNDCDGIIDDGFDVITAALHIQANTHTVGSGAHPGSTKEPLADLTVDVYESADGSCARNLCEQGVSWQCYADIVGGCSPVTSGLTNTVGEISFELAPGGYLVIGDDGTDKHLGTSVSLVCGDSSQKHLQRIVTSSGKVLPAKTTERTGSVLLVIEPEYVEWTGTDELYPFVFESLGDWDVTVSVAPPEGFVADYSNLSEDVTSETKAVQFTITDLGSDWVPTHVQYVLEHHGRREVILSRIGVALSDGLARWKGLGRFGHVLDHNGPARGFDPRAQRPAEIVGWIEPSSSDSSYVVKLRVNETTDLNLQVTRGRGQVVRSLTQGLIQPGEYQFVWDGLDADGNQLLPGRYGLTLVAGPASETVPLVER